MDYQIEYTPTAKKDLGKLDKLLLKIILKKLLENSKLSNPLDRAKKLTGCKVNTYSFRIGDYRAIFRVDLKTKQLVILVVLRVRHRKEVYKKMQF